MLRFLMFCGLFFSGNLFAGMPIANISTPAVQTVTQRTVSYRYPSGHTHTCPQCGDVWDHAKNPTHICQQCGAQSWIQDRGTKLVPVYTTRTLSTPQTTGGIILPVAAVQSSTYVAAPVRTATPLFLPSIGGCPNGQCPSSVTRTRGIFR